MSFLMPMGFEPSQLYSVLKGISDLFCQLIEQMMPGQYNLLLFNIILRMPFSFYMSPQPSFGFVAMFVTEFHAIRLGKLGQLCKAFEMCSTYDAYKCILDWFRE